MDRWVYDAASLFRLLKSRSENVSSSIRSRAGNPLKRSDFRIEDGKLGDGNPRRIPGPTEILQCRGLRVEQTFREILTPNFDSESGQCRQRDNDVATWTFAASVAIHRQNRWHREIHDRRWRSECTRLRRRE